ncbi:polysaccharide pyruvyl transferase family protein [Alphaproteobacteria bacterium]|nr:polysaccharide pyruvyl transferase family protein [Alphaproteobacteria bacterium]
MRVLHIASFVGNFGDLFSHHSLYYHLYRTFKNVEIDRKEIRDFYLNGRESGNFKNFIDDSVDNYDLLVIGGGGFLSPRKEYSKSSSKCLIEINDATIKKYGHKIAFVSLGYEGSNVSQTQTEIVSQAGFLNHIARNGASIWLREDNGTEVLRRHLDPEIEIGMDVSAFSPFQAAKKVMGQQLTLGLFVSGGRGDLIETKEGDLLLASYKKLLNAAFDLGAQIKIFCNTHQDVAVLASLVDHKIGIDFRKLINIRMLCNPDINVPEAIRDISECHIIYSARYHGGMAALSTGVPFITPIELEKPAFLGSRYGLSYSTKEIAEGRLNLEKYQLKPFHEGSIIPFQLKRFLEFLGGIKKLK